MQTEEIVSGPIPSASELAAIRDVMPDGPERIFTMAEQLAAHYRGIETTAIQAEAADMRWARAASMLVPATGLGAGLLFLQAGQPTAGATVCCAAMLPNLVAALLKATSAKGEK